MLVCSSSSDVIFEDQMYLSSQNGSTRLDKFTHCFLVKCSVEVQFALNLLYFVGAHCICVQLAYLPRVNPNMLAPQQRTFQDSYCTEW